MAQPSLTTILKFADKLDISSSTLIPDLRTKIAVFPVNDLPTKYRESFETKGIALWNLATRHNRRVENEDTSESAEITKVALLRVFAFGLLDSVALTKSRKKNREESCVRILKVALKCVKACVQADELDFAGKVAARAAEWLAAYEGPDLKKRLSAEYYVWRMALAWKQDKLDTAEHMYEKSLEYVKDDPESIEDLADIFYEIGNGLCDKKHFELAATWLERALDAVDDQELHRLSDDAGDLRLAILQKLVKSLLMIRTPEAMKSARYYVDIVENSYSDKLVAQLMKLEMIGMEAKPEAADYFSGISITAESWLTLALTIKVVTTMTRTMMLTRVNFKTIMHHIHKLKKLDATLAGKALEELITLRLSQDAKVEWIERACMLRLWIAMSTEGVRLHADALKKFLDQMQDIVAKPFSAAAAHAAQMLLWSHIESDSNTKQYATAESYCEIALHALFNNCGEINKGKIGRKWMMCALARLDATAAREVYFRLPESQRNTPETRHIAYKTALQMSDGVWAAESLQLVAKQVDNDLTRLYACVLDAVQSGYTVSAYQALKILLDKFDHERPRGISLPALLRCMIRIIRKNMKDAKDDPMEMNDAVSTLASLFETAVEHIEKFSASKNDFNADELSWFSKNSYNTAIEFLDMVNSEVLYRLCVVASLLIQRLDRDTPPTEETNLRLRHIFSEYLAMTIMIALARGEDNIEASHECDRAVMQHGAMLRDLVAEEMEADTLSMIAKADLTAKHIQSIKFELEATLRLKKWDALTTLFNLCWKYDDPKRWHNLADLAFSIHQELCDQGTELTEAYQRTVLLFIERIVNESWKSNEPVQKLAKHLRCFFHLTFTKDDELAGKCADQVIGIAEQSKMSNSPYPTTELEWMAATTFNQAVSCYCVKDDVKCQYWAEKALTLAGLMDDGGALGEQIRKNYSQLQFDKTG